MLVSRSLNWESSAARQGRPFDKPNILTLNYGTQEAYAHAQNVAVSKNCLATAVPRGLFSIIREHG